MAIGDPMLGSWGPPSEYPGCAYSPRTPTRMPIGGPISGGLYESQEGV